MIAQSANILFYLGPRLKLSPRDEAGRLWLHQLQLTVTDFVKEIHDTHHPLGGELYYEDAKPEAKRYTENFLAERAPKYLGYFETVLKKSGDPYALGRKVTYIDLAVPVDRRPALCLPQGDGAHRAKNSCRGRRARPRRQRPRIKAYLASPRRIDFNESGIFRHYAELDE